MSHAWTELMRNTILSDATWIDFDQWRGRNCTKILKNQMASTANHHSTWLCRKCDFLKSVVCDLDLSSRDLQSVLIHGSTWVSFGSNPFSASRSIEFRRYLWSSLRDLDLSTHDLEMSSASSVSRGPGIEYCDETWRWETDSRTGSQTHKCT